MVLPLAVVAAYIMDVGVEVAVAKAAVDGVVIVTTQNRNVHIVEV